MKRVLYNTCVVDPWADIALKLQKDHQMEPVYWIGYSYDDSYHVVCDMFPQVVYQSTEEAWKCIFPKAVEDAYADAYVDVDFLRKYAHNELQAFTMMNRIDFDTYSFNHMERERHYLNLIKYWTACFKVYKIDIVISAVNPHRVYDYVLYLLCRYWGIPFITFQYSMMPGRIFALSNFSSIGNIFDKDYRDFLGNGNLKWVDLDSLILNSYKKVTSDYSVAEPSYMIRNKREDKQCNKIWSHVFRYIKRRRDFSKKQKMIQKQGLFRNNQTCFKRKWHSLESTYLTPWNYFFMWMKAISRKKKMKDYYESKASSSQTGAKYIYFPMHYQPEATSSPIGDMYVNQFLCIEMLLKHTPDYIFIYVKEHSSQFMSQFLGHTCRIKEFYYDISRNPRVKLISIETNPYELMKNAFAVATITGTAGWEAICNRIPVIAFGTVWYEKYSGVIRVTSDTSAKELMDFLTNYEYCEQDLLAYLHAFQKQSIRAYHYKGYKEASKVSKEESVRNLSEQIITMVGDK
jgi:hypothetical protein